MKKKARQANMELLRIIAMLMVVTLHYLIKGQAAVSLVENTGVINLIIWYLNAMCIVTINIYVLISGYFLLEAKWKISRLISLWFQTMFYSIGIPVVCLALGVGDVDKWGLYDWVNVIFPIQMEHYWFITAYTVLYLFVPILGAGLKQLTKQQHEVVIAGLLLIFSIPKTVLPIYIPTDRNGYDFGWFLCLFVIAAYVRMYGIPFLNKKSRGFEVYFLAITGMWLISVGCGILSRKGLALEHAMDMPYCHNHLLVLIAALGLFYGFGCIKIPQGRVSNVICKISSYSLGVYLLHENLAVRTKWQFWMGIERVKDGIGIFPHMLLTIFAVFVAGVMVDFVRECIFKVVQRTWRKVFAGRIAIIEK
ncbi:MAG: acyltransferase [Lachnospiraceae bacterium]|nr:acyltransferase [Lachnospiraceae bacterium]